VWGRFGVARAGREGIDRIGIARKNRIAASARIGDDKFHEQQSANRINQRYAQQRNAKTLHPARNAAYDNQLGDRVEAGSFARSASPFFLWSNNDRSVLPA
jgi:hypothetical protein